MSTARRLWSVVVLAPPPCHMAPVQASREPACISIWTGSMSGGWRTGWSCHLCEPGTSMVAPLAWVKSSTAMTALSTNGGCGRGTGHRPSSWCRPWALAPGKRSNMTTTETWIW